MTVNDTFNPYRQWLGIEIGPLPPNHYQLLGLPVGASDPEQVAMAADRAMSRVRSFRPGDQAQAWSRLLDELQAAKVCLLDPSKRQQYDQQIAQQAATSRVPTATPTASVSPTSASVMARPQPLSSPVASQPAPGGEVPLDPMAPLPMQTPTTAPPGPIASPAPSASARAMDGPMAPLSGPSPAVPSQQVGQMPGPPSPAATRPPGDNPMAPLASTAANPMGPMPNGYGASSNGASASPMQPSPVVRQPPNPAIPAASAAAMNPMAPAPSTTPAAMQPTATGVGGIPSPAPYSPDANPQAPLNMPTPAVAPVANNAPEATPIERVPQFGAGPSAAKRASQRAKDAKNSIAAVGVGVALILLIGGAVIFAMGGFGGAPNTDDVTENQPQQPAPPRKLPNVVRQPRSPSKPSTIENASPEPPSPSSRSEPGPSVTPDPDPRQPMIEDPAAPTAPAPEPNPTPPTAPSPPEPAPAPAPKPTPAELKELGNALTDARAALGAMDFASAKAALAKAEPLTKLPEHKAARERLARLAQLAEEFRTALIESIGKLEAGESLKIGTSTEVAVVETRADSVILHVAGSNRTYQIDSMPIALAVGIADHVQVESPQWLIVKGAYVIAHQDAVDDAVEKAKGWWKEAAQSGGELGDLEMVLEDDYEFEGEES